MTGETIHTWADGFGNWHAKVTFPAPGYDGAQMKEHGPEARRKAQRAIRRGLEIRHQPGTLAPVRIVLERWDLDDDNVTHSVTYAEVVRDA